MHNLTPLGDRVLVRLMDRENESSGGVLLPEMTKDKPTRGEVVALGESAFEHETVAPGDVVIFSKFAGTTLPGEDDSLVVLREDDILVRVG